MPNFDVVGEHRSRPADQGVIRRTFLFSGGGGWTGREKPGGEQARSENRVAVGGTSKPVGPGGPGRCARVVFNPGPKDVTRTAVRVFGAGAGGSSRSGVIV